MSPFHTSEINISQSQPLLFCTNENVWQIFLHLGLFKYKTENYRDSLHQDALFRKLESVSRKKLLHCADI